MDTKVRTWISGATVHAASTGWEGKPLTVVIEGSRISALLPSEAQTPGDARVVDASGLHLIPGLIDLHCHLTFRRTIGPIWQMMAQSQTMNAVRAVRNALTVLRQGITTIRETGAPNDINTEIARAVATGMMPGPRILSAGIPLSVTGGHARNIVLYADGAEEFRKTARHVLSTGASWIKIIGSNDPTYRPHEDGQWSFGEVDADEVSAVVAVARKWGGRVAVHCMGSRQIKLVARCGVDTIEHGVYIAPDGALAMAENGVSLVPTISGYLETTWPRWRRGDDWRARHQHLADVHMEAVPIARAAGVRIGVGTDSVGEIVHELKLLHRCGMSIAECLEAVTKTNAAILGLDGLIGDVAPGLEADLVLLRQNPAGGLDALRSVERIIQAGRVSRPLDIQLPSGDEAGESEPWLGKGTLQ
ncbi:MAG: amidohydrolase family protein [Rhodobacteraceae bacterium]|jgi:imidazolonepropionase-like amidohydrolase|nr:amidohydrolase family protein [Paracoccaceae bacterium]